MGKFKNTIKTLKPIFRKDLWLPALSIVLGTLMWSISINGILVHHKFMSGGVSGLALVIYYLFPNLSIGLMVFLMNIPIFLLSRVGVIPSITFFSASSLTAAITNAGFQMIEQKDLSVRPLRECFIVARKSRRLYVRQP